MILSRLSVVIPILAGLIYYFCFKKETLEHVVLKTSKGTLQGFKSLSRQGRPIFNFRKIPYAKSPIGQLRFQPPVEFGNWEGVLDGTAETPVCIQADTLWKKISGQEDCLYLNVYTPKIPKAKDEKLLPVMVFIHGGHFMFGGSGIFGPQYFLDEDVILVTLNYRVGALGFLNAGKDALGNMGLKDQVMALKWVQSTIKDFGGDPALTTIFGNSAGGASVNFHMISPLSRGLFHRAISQSGTAFCPWADVEKDTESQVRRLGKKLNCPKGSQDDIFKCINSTSGTQLVETQTECYDIFHAPEAIYGPSFESKGDLSTAFLTRAIFKSYMDSKSISRIPWMLGVNSEDGCYRSAAFITDQNQLQDVYKNWNILAPNILMLGKNGKSEAPEEILKFYFGKVPNKFTTADYEVLTNMFSDRYFFGCTGQAARLHAQNSDTYLYYFTKKGDASLGEAVAASKGNYPVLLELLAAMAKKFIYSKVLGWKTHEFGTCHADDLRYLFRTIPTWDILVGSPHFEFSKSLVKLWTSFAKNGKPDRYRGLDWIKAEADKIGIRYFHLDDLKKTKGMLIEPFTERVEFWKTLEL